MTREETLALLHKLDNESEKEKKDSFKEKYNNRKFKDIYGQSVSSILDAGVNQPKFGFVAKDAFEIIQRDSSDEIEDWWTGTNIIGATVEKLTHYQLDNDIENAFKTALRGAKNIDSNAYRRARNALHKIKGLDDNSIINAIKLAEYDVFYYTLGNCIPPSGRPYIEVEYVDYIRIMVKRSVELFKEYGPVILNGYEFSEECTKTVSVGAIDFLTQDTLWDLKVSGNPFSKRYRTQLLLYWRMATHSNNPAFQTLKYLAIYNPIKNEIGRIEISKINPVIAEILDEDIFGYHK